jgi:predicted polyphosphate/ATP-dependent NAD kinase
VPVLNRQKLRVWLAEIIAGMDADTLYVIGPGTTTRSIMERLGLPNTLLGVDVIFDRKLIARDVN